MIRFPTELVGEELAREASVFFTEALAKLNARQFRRAAGQDLPCCARCAGCSLDEGAALQDARRLLETSAGHPVSIVAYSMGKELAAGRACRPVLIDGQRLAYQVEDSEVLDPVSKFNTEESCCCGQHDDDDDGRA